MKSCKVYTPAGLAEAMTRALGNESGLRWLEPSFGRAAFVKQISKVGVTPDNIVAIDLDTRSSSSDKLATALRGSEFLAWAETQQPSFDRIIGNPPYIAIERLRGDLRDKAAAIKYGSIKPLGLNGNLWAAFLIGALKLLRPQGNLSFVLPAAWGYADYAEELRGKLPTYFRKFVIHRSRAPLFETVLDGCYVIQGFGFGEPNRVKSSHFFKEPSDLIAALQTQTQPPLRSSKAKKLSPTQSTVKAETLFQVRLGAVTGDAKYFLLSEKRRQELGLPLSSVVPVVTRAKHLRVPEIDKKVWQQIRDQGDRAYLFKPSEESLNSDAVQRYLRLPYLQGGCNRKAGWVLRRAPWYNVNVPTELHAFMSGVSSFGPWISHNGMKKLLATNTLYVIRFAEAMQTRDQRAACSLALLTSFVREQVRNRTRTYAGGMMKLEPSDIMSLLLPTKQDSSGAHDAHRNATELLLQGSAKQSADLADEWFATD